MFWVCPPRRTVARGEPSRCKARMALSAYRSVPKPMAPFSASTAAMTAASTSPPVATERPTAPTSINVGTETS